MDLISPSALSRGSMASGDVLQNAQHEAERGSEEDAGLGPSISGRVTPIQAQMVADNDGYEDLTNELNPTKTDYYASREVDYYYGVRGPALSSGTRRLKTGPADPTGPVSSATGWFRNLFGGKTKEKGKGFEVVRSARAPSHGRMPGLDGTVLRGEPYRYSPTDSQHPDRRYGDFRGGHQEDLGEPGGFVRPYTDEGSDEDAVLSARVSPVAPSLPAIDAGGNIELPSRGNSRRSQVSGGAGAGPGRPPYIPRRSSKRKSSQAAADFPAAHLSTVTASPPSSPPKARSPGHKHLTAGAESAASSAGAIGDEENQAPSFSHGQNPSSALGAHAPDIREDRPSSMGYVPQHRASDNIRKIDSGSPEFASSTAEFVGSPTQRVRLA